MRASASTLAVGLLLSVALPSGIASASDPGEQLLLERANYWREQHRLELAGEILNKLLALNPDQPDALYQQGLLATERGDRSAAQQYFDRLRQLAPSDKRAAELLGEPSQPKTAAPGTAVTVAVAVANPPATPVKVGTRVIDSARICRGVGGQRRFASGQAFYASRRFPSVGRAPDERRSRADAAGGVVAANHGH
jgi:tetratricopeptide (TPR) repeat protein